jgi:anaphase-promoting complex subunit 4
MTKAVAMAEGGQLRLLGQKTLHHSADSTLVSYCPSMDLVAVTTSDNQVLVHRLNGQRLYAITQKTKSTKIAKITWKPDGRSVPCLLPDMSG